MILSKLSIANLISTITSFMDSKGMLPDHFTINSVSVESTYECKCSPKYLKLCGTSPE